MAPGGAHEFQGRFGSRQFRRLDAPSDYLRVRRLRFTRILVGRVALRNGKVWLRRDTNVDGLIRVYEDASFREWYSRAAFVLLDSRVAALLFRLVHGIRVPVLPGSDLTAALLHEVINPEDRVVLIGSTAEQAQALRERFGLKHLLHHNPPMGFIRDSAAVEACLQFVEASSPFRYCLIAVGDPQG